MRRVTCHSVLKGKQPMNRRLSANDRSIGLAVVTQRQLDYASIGYVIPRDGAVLVRTKINLT